MYRPPEKYIRYTKQPNIQHATQARIKVQTYAHKGRHTDTCAHASGLFRRADKNTRLSRKQAAMKKTDSQKSEKNTGRLAGTQMRM